jgi:hypothetical protein
MKPLLLSIILFFCFFVLNGQIRNGWRSVYDKDGRLTRMNYYDNGRNVIDSSMYFQFYTDNAIKAFITGEFSPQNGEVNGLVALFDEAGNLTSYANKEKSETLFDVRCDYNQACKAIWLDEFNLLNDEWECGDFSIYDGQMIIHNQTMIGEAIYSPNVPVNIDKPFNCRVEIPVKGNSAKQGIAIGWADKDNYLLFEISFGTYYNVYQSINGELNDLTQGRKKIENPSESINAIVLRNTGENILFEINEKLEMVIPLPKFKGDKIALLTRAKGDAKFASFIFASDIGESDHFYEQVWIGKGSGFFISSNRILTTFDVISDARKLRARARIGGQNFILPLKILRLEEENNLAVLMVDDKSFKAFDQIPYGYSNTLPVSESSVWALGYPNAVSAIYMPPEVYEGKVLPTSSMTVGYRLLEMPFRFGLMGAPVFDNDANLIGITAYKGLDLRYTEIIDFHDNSRLLKATIGKFDNSLDAEIKSLSLQEKIKLLSETVVIIESNVFGEYAVQY